MNTHADKTQENKSQSVSDGTSQIQGGGESTFQFVDNRPEAIAQRKLQEMANNSPQALQIKTIQDMAKNSPQVKQAAQLQSMADNHSAQQQESIQKKENNTGLPNNLKTGMENLSGMSLDDVKVHRNSDKPAQLQAHAYAQGTDIHLGSGQEKHLQHEAWHVVQQKQGRVKPTMQMKGKVNVNDDAGLEKEADLMGAKAAQWSSKMNNSVMEIKASSASVAQLFLINKLPNKDDFYDYCVKKLKEIEKKKNLIKIKNKYEDKIIKTYEVSDHEELLTDFRAAYALRMGDIEEFSGDVDDLRDVQGEAAIKLNELEQVFSDKASVMKGQIKEILAGDNENFRIMFDRISEKMDPCLNIVKQKIASQISDSEDKTAGFIEDLGEQGDEILTALTKGFINGWNKKESKFAFITKGLALLATPITAPVGALAKAGGKAALNTDLVKHKAAKEAGKQIGKNINIDKAVFNVIFKIHETFPELEIEPNLEEYIKENLKDNTKDAETIAEGLDQLILKHKEIPKDKVKKVKKATKIAGKFIKGLGKGTIPEEQKPIEKRKGFDKVKGLFKKPSKEGEKTILVGQNNSSSADEESNSQIAQKLAVAIAGKVGQNAGLSAKKAYNTK